MIVMRFDAVQTADVGLREAIKVGLAAREQRQTVKRQGRNHESVGDVHAELVAAEPSRRIGLPWKS
jgi:hypothetical protein